MKASWWQKAGPIVAVISVSVAIASGILGATFSFASDKASIQGQLSEVSKRVDASDARQALLDDQLRSIAQDLAVVKAILERIEKKLGS